MPNEANDRSGTGCQSYCEVKVTYFHGQEIPYNFDCRAGPPYALTKSESVTHTDSWTIEVGATIGTRDDGSLMYNETGLIVREDVGAPLKEPAISGRTVTNTWWAQIGKPDNETRCGHFSWVPWKVRSCGTLTRAEVKETIKPVVCPSLVCPVNDIKSCDKTNLSSTENWCVETQDMTDDKTSMGTDIFVVVDCGTNAPTPDKQDKIYHHRGVSDTNWIGNPSTARG
ncbi:hypothetical protein JX265_006863 [Neoarthrinium moseri]|uniref:Uncharacterized protein n=1 Tax=Neoarthrinium moseri TaxID=1658444 RepID=A0A9Q0AQ07_9PEZI|nr:hypothetical protein JX265_006863 [Neoarthrinium moseri]